jgi:hypothetical protein
MLDIFDFEIYFFGLICIHGKSKERDAEKWNKIQAILLDDEQHKPLLFLDDENKKFALDRRSNVIFKNVGEGEATVLKSFDNYVPHLVQLTTPEVKLNLNAHSIRVALPPGRLAAVDRYDKKGEYCLNGKKVVRPTDCIGRVSLLHVKTVLPTIRVKFKSDGQERDEPASGWALLSNAEPTDEDATEVIERSRRDDFDKHASATDHDAQYLADLYELKDDCTETINNPPDIKARHLSKVTRIISKHHRVFAHPECSNTNWP